MAYKKTGNLTGKNFGRWTVLSKSIITKSGRLWLCRCACGTERLVSGESLKKGKSKSCGCLQKEVTSKRPFEDLSGKQFGRWLVLGTWKIDKNKGRVWLCRCNCGTERFVKASLLKCGDSQSCGCLNKEKVSSATKIDLSGKHFNRWLVLYEYGRTSTGAILWWCRCDCGKERAVISGSLLSGRSNSCGCYKKEKVTKHGKSDTIEYKVMQSRKHREIRKKLDIKWTFEMDEALRSFQSACSICGMSEKEHLEKYGQRLHIDHVLPLSAGNGLKPGNAIVLCHYHNISKVDKSLNRLPLDWQAKILWNAFKFKDCWDTKLMKAERSL